MKGVDVIDRLLRSHEAELTCRESVAHEIHYEELKQALLEAVDLRDRIAQK
jgi:hypothetical protein